MCHRNNATGLLSKLLENIFHHLNTIRRKGLEAVLDNLWNCQAPREPLRSLEPLHLPHLKLHDPRNANLDALTQSQEPPETLLEASPNPSNRSNDPSQICDTDPELLGQSKRSNKQNLE